MGGSIIRWCCRWGRRLPIDGVEGSAKIIWHERFREGDQRMCPLVVVQEDAHVDSKVGGGFIRVEGKEVHHGFVVLVVPNAVLCNEPFGDRSKDDGVVLEDLLPDGGHVELVGIDVKPHQSLLHLDDVGIFASIESFEVLTISLTSYMALRVRPTLQEAGMSDAPSVISISFLSFQWWSVTVCSSSVRSFPAKGCRPLWSDRM